MPVGIDGIKGDVIDGEGAGALDAVDSNEELLKIPPMPRPIALLNSITL